MLDENLAKQLHARATSGEPLTPAEQAMLNDWYEQEDRAEANLILGPAQNAGEAPLELLRKQVDASFRKIAALVKQVEQAEAENRALRDEIALLRKNFSARLDLQAA